MKINMDKLAGDYIRSYSESWEYLKQELSAIEYCAALRLMLLISKDNNSILYINNKTTYKELIKVLGVSTNKVKSVIQKLHDLGIYRQFEVGGPFRSYRNYWIFNPYLCLNGTHVSTEIKELFEDTKVAMEYRLRCQMKAN
jgi:hypothetical protein